MSGESRLDAESYLMLEVVRSIAADRPLRLSEDLTRQISWGRVIELAVRHKMLPLVASRLIQSSARTLLYERQLHTIFLDAMQTNILRRNKRQEVAVEVSSALERGGIACLARKGLVYDSVLYGNMGLRHSNDIDFFIERSTKTSAEVCLEQIGFGFGIVDPFTALYQSMDRSEYLIYRLYPDHVPPLVKKLDDRFQISVKIDLSFDLAWHNSGLGAWADPMLEGAFLHKVRDRTTGLWTAPLWFHFVDCCLHLFREAYSESSIKIFAFNGVTLQKFLDVALLWRSLGEDQRKTVRDSTKGSGSAALLAWVAYHTDVVLETNILAELGLADALKDGFEQTWQRSDGSIRMWSGDMVERLFGSDHLRIFGTTFQ
ncbi:nucleotidyltransferase family protein [Inquilinus limosus]|uniref:nucleotidyltransferase family protein n=1 Tax=Inquilinus limosus TaxID=171674 RepID=UPI003F137EDF